MKGITLQLCTALVLGTGVGAVCLCQANQAAPAPIGVFIGNDVKAEEWGDAAKLQKKLAQQIQAAWPSIKPADVQKGLSEPQNRLLLAQWMLAEAELAAVAEAETRQQQLQKKINELQAKVDAFETKRQQLGTLHPRDERQLKLTRQQLNHYLKEIQQPRTLRTAIKTPQDKKLLEALGNAPDWLEQMVYTGHLLRPAKVLALLRDIETQHPDMQTNAMVRDIATATALEFAKSDWLHDIGVDRADYFISHWKQGDLNTVFNTLPFWERRMVCGCWGDNAFGGRPSLEWALENFRVPAERYIEDCPHHLYRLYNLYGDSIHGEHYNEPYADFYDDNMCQFVIEVGGICGNLSKYCTFSALANGIPALTTGEPGHCSYVVKVGDTWTPGYSLDWRRGLQWLPWPDMTVFSCLHMASELFSDREKDNTRLSNAYRVLAAVYATSAPAKALTCYQEAVKAQPLNIYAWREYASFLTEFYKNDTEEWNRLNSLLCNSLAKRYPEIAAKVLEQSVYPGLKNVLYQNEAALAQAFVEFWNNVSVMGPDRWRIEEMLHVQKEHLCGDRVDDTLFSFYSNVLKIHASNKEYGPAILSWGNDLAGSMNKEDSARILNCMMKGMGGTSMDAESKAKMLEPIILAAEKSRDLTTFQALSKMLPDVYLHPQNKIPTPEPFPGQLMSKGGLLWASSTCSYDNPCRHWGVLEPGVGGEFHTDNQKNPWVVVQLPKQTKVSGVVAVGRGNNVQRMDGMILQVSETGRDDDWHDVAPFTKPKARIYRAASGDNLPVAKYIRIYRTGDRAEPFHLEGIYVYGFPSA